MSYSVNRRILADVSIYGFLDLHWYKHWPKNSSLVGALQDDLFWILKMKAPSNGFPGVAVLAMENLRVSNQLHLLRVVPMCFIVRCQDSEFWFEKHNYELSVLTYKTKINSFFHCTLQAW